MTLFALLIIMAIERVTTKSKQFHIATLCQQYFSFLRDKNLIKDEVSHLTAIAIAAVPAIVIYAVFWWVPLLIEFVIILVVLWVCIGCPVTRATYKKYLAAANREDFEACALHSISFGNQGGKLDNVGKQLVLVNYRQYVSVVIFFVLTGVAGLVFYSIIKELSLQTKQQEQRIEDKTPTDTILFILDWIPVRITTFGFLVVGHFSNAFSYWLTVLMTPGIQSYDALGLVAKAAEDVSECNTVIDEPLQLVKLVKRNLVFILMLTALGTMVGLVR
ncbi:regulatory signaling modulator protein AmpE [Glaciecola sp. 1036]|uniref:regulatory signaling modulator protein AmpE n=1 Tax=Alteromonadaceae TaxID=72275 RepID=UPI003D04F179